MEKEYEYGNDPGKIDRYRAFWDRAKVDRPLIGFTLVGWFPLAYFAPSRGWKIDRRVTPEMIDPEEWLADQERLLEEGNVIDDDMLRGACPSQVALPIFLPAMFGANIRVLPDNVIGEEMKLPMEQALEVRFNADSPWIRKYLEFTDVLVEKAGGRYPVSHGTELGPADLHAVLRGHNESLIDLLDEPERTSTLLEKLGSIFIDFATLVWDRIPRFHGGYYDAQYQLWSPGPIVRMQEDATAVFSPDLYRRLVQPVDTMIAKRFTNCFMHLHSTSMFLLDAFLEIEELRCLEINLEPLNIPTEEMIPYFREVQDAGRSLLVRGSVTPDEMRLLVDSLDPRGLYIHVVIEKLNEVDDLRRAAGM